MGRNNADFHGVTFAYGGMTHMQGFGPNDPAPKAHLFTAHKDGQQVGKLQLQRGGTVDYVEVHPDYQRQGIATGLYNFAKQESERTGGTLPYPVHSPMRSPEGDAWAKSTKEKLPPNEAN
jgi:GNAT superfamily N-acetyltransferase